MVLEVGSVVEGVVTGIAKFGAFVDIGDKKTGLVHISEVSSAYVTDINEVVSVQDRVKVKILSIDDKGKFALSMKQVEAAEEQDGGRESFRKERPAERSGKGSYRGSSSSGNFNRAPRGGGFHASRKNEAPVSFEDKLSRFLKDSDERLLDLKRNVESKRGGRGARRSD